MQLRALLPVLLLAFLVTGFQSASAAIMLGGGYTHTHDAVPGAQLSGSFTLKNMGRKPAEVKLYMEDIHHGRARKRSNMSWVKLSANRLIIAPGSTKTVTYRVKTPGGNHRGTYWSALIVEPVNKNSVESDQRAAKGGKQISVTIQQVVRHAIAIVTNFRGGKANVSFSAPQMKRDAKTGKRSFSVLTRNTGTGWVGKGMQSWINVYDNRGNFVGKFDGEQSSLYPGANKRLAVDISRLRPGQYKGLFAVAPKDGQMFGTDVSIKIK